MTIGANDILNTTEISQDKSSAKKKDYTSEDFSTISNQFANIFTTQFTNHFNNQFDYSANNKKTDFMANTATSMTENKYYAAANNERMNSSQSQSQVQTQSQSQTQAEYQTQAQKPTESQSQPQNQTKTESQSEVQKQAKTEETTQQNKQTSESKSDTSSTAQAKANSEQLEVEVEMQNKNNISSEQQKKRSEENNASTAAINNATNNNVANKSEKKVTVNVDSSETKNELKGAVSTVQKTESIKVAIKEDQLKVINELTQNNQTPVSEVKDAKIEKLEVKTAKKTVTDATKEADAKAEANVDTKAKVKTEETEKAIAETKNRTSLERLTANVVEAATAETVSLDKIINKENKKTLHQATKESTEAKPQVEFKNPTAFAQQNSEQNFGQNQNNQQSLKDNILKELLPFGTSFFKNNITGNMPFGNIMQNTQQGSPLERSITDQVLNQIKSNLSEEKSEVSMVLQPEKLGKVTLNIMNEKGVLSAEIKTESKEAAAALNKNINDLKETLKEQGIICTNLVVKVEDSQKSDNQMNFAHQNQDSTPRNFEQGGNAQNSDKNSFQNNSNKSESAEAEYQKNIQEEKEQTATIEKADNNGLVDYRV